MRRPDSLKGFAFWQIPCSIRPVTRIAWTLIIALLIAGATRAGFADFAVYWRAGGQALAGQSVYLEPGHFQFKYSPAVAALLGAITKAIHRFFVLLGLPAGTVLEPYSNAIVVTGAIRATAVTLYFAYAALWIVWARRVAERWAPGVLLMLILPWIEELSLGQLNILPLILMGPLLFLLERGRSNHRQMLTASLALSVAIQIKLYALIAFPLLLFRRRWNVLVATAIFTLVINAIVPSLAGSPTFALHEFSAWLRTLSTSTGGLLESRFNISWLGLMVKLFGNARIGAALWLPICVSYLAILWIMRHRPWRELSALLVSGIVILNPLSWYYWPVFLVPVLAPLLAEASHQNPSNRFFRALLVIAAIGFSALHVRWVQDWVHPILVLATAAAWARLHGKPVSVPG
jgi:hypothetical protein